MFHTVINIFVLFAFYQAAPSNHFAKYDVARIDERGHRVFVVKAETFVRNYHKLRPFLKNLSKEIIQVYPAWKKDLNISIFSKKDAVGYKDEPRIEALVKHGEWEKFFLAEYSIIGHVCIIYPLSPQRQLNIKIPE